MAIIVSQPNATELDDYRESFAGCHREICIAAGLVGMALSSGVHAGVYLPSITKGTIAIGLQTVATGKQATEWVRF